MAQFNNQLPVSASIRYTATDNSQPLQHLNAHSVIASIKDVKPNKNVNVKVGDITQAILAPLNVNQVTLNIIQDLGNMWHLQWV